MKTYNVNVIRIEYKSTTLNISAETPEEAKALAKQQADGFNWKYADVIDHHQDVHVLDLQGMENK